MKRRLVVAEIMVAVALSCVVLVWMSGVWPGWIGSLAARLDTTRPVGQYSIDVLDWGPFGRVMDINMAGQAAGTASTGRGEVYAAVWNDGETLSCHKVEANLLSSAVALSADGTVAFNVRELNQDGSWAYVQTPDGEVICLNDVLPETRSCSVEDMNAGGNAVGTVEVEGGARHAFIWNATDGMRLLDGSLSVALGISDHGIIVGLDRSRSAGGRPCAWVPVPDGGYSLIHLNEEGGVEGRAYAVNRQGVVVGRLEGPWPMRWDASTGLQVLPGLEALKAGWARDVNDLGDIVGCLTGFGGGRAVIWRNGRAHDLNDHIPQADQWHLMEAMAINNDGVIACRTVFEDGLGVVLLIPRGS
ncbi:MAG: hypothetical protein ACOX9R_06890 [Armatimonadota bacterium]